MKKLLLALLAIVALGGGVAAQSPLFYAYGNIQSRTVVSPNTYNVTVSNFNGGYRDYPNANYETTDIGTTNFALWAGCVRFTVTNVVSTSPLVLRVTDAIPSGGLDGTDLVGYRILVIQEAMAGTYRIGAFGNVADGNAGSQAGIGPFDMACVQNYYKSQTAAAIGAGFTVSVTGRLSGDGTVGAPLDIARQGATTGQVLKFNGSTWAPANDISGGGATIDSVRVGYSSAGTEVKVNNTMSPAVKVPLVALAQSGATTNQVPKWNGTAWVPAADAGGVNILSNDTTQWNVATGTEMVLKTTPTVAPRIYQDGVGKIAYQLNVRANSLDSTHVKDRSLRLLELNQSGATTNQVPKWNGTAWVPAADNAAPAATNLTAASTKVAITNGTGAVLGGTPVTVDVQEGNLNPTNIPITDTGGYFTTDNINAALQQLGASSHSPVTVTDGTIIDLTVTGQNLTATVIAGSITTTEIANGTIVGADISQMSATSGQVLKWNGSTWAPAADNSTPTTTNLTAASTKVTIANGTGAVIGSTPVTVDVNEGNLNPANITITDTGSYFPTDNVNAALQTLGANSHAPVTVTDGAIIDFTLTGQNVAATVAPGSITTTEIANATILGADIAQNGATSGQVFKWNGSTWAPASDQSGITSASNDTTTFSGLNGVQLSLRNSGTISNRIYSPVAGTLVFQPSVKTNSLDSTHIKDRSLRLLELNQSGATTGQVPQWNGTTWVAATPSASAGADSTWVKTNGAYAGKRITDNVYRTGKLGLNTTDTTATLNLRSANPVGSVLTWLYNHVAPPRSAYKGPTWTNSSQWNLSRIDINPMKPGHFPSFNYGVWTDQLFVDSTTNAAVGAPGNSIRNVGFNVDGANPKMARWYWSTEQYYYPTFGGSIDWEHHLEVRDTLNRINRPFNLNARHNGNFYGAGFRVNEFYFGKPFSTDYGLRVNLNTGEWSTDYPYTFKINNSTRVGRIIERLHGGSHLNVLDWETSGRLQVGDRGGLSIDNKLYFSNSNGQTPKIVSQTGNFRFDTTEVAIRVVANRQLTLEKVGTSERYEFLFDGTFFAFGTNVNTAQYTLHKSAPNSSFSIDNTGRVGLGLGDAFAKLHIQQPVDDLSGGLMLNSLAGPYVGLYSAGGGELNLNFGGSNRKFFGQTTAPNGTDVASPADLKFRDNSGTGELWVKKSGYATNTGWEQVITTTGTSTSVSRLMREQAFAATASQTAFALSGYTPPAVSGTSVPVRVYRNGAKLRYVASGPTVSQFTYSGSTITVTACAAGDEIVIEYLD